jgi:hypothetical protein
MKYIKTVEIEIYDIDPSVAAFCEAADITIEVSTRHGGKEDQLGCYYSLHVFIEELGKDTMTFDDPHTNELFAKALLLNRGPRYDGYFDWAYLSMDEKEAQEMLRAYVSDQKRRYPNCVIVAM